MRRTGFYTLLTVAAVSGAFLPLLQGCGDLGNEPPSRPAPVIGIVQPDSGEVGDTVRISGSGFGSMRASSFVRFGATVASAYEEWEDTLIVAIVPAGASSGAITVTVETATSSGTEFIIVGTATVVRSFANDVLPRLILYGCAGCHGGSGGLFVDTQPHLLQGGNHGPAIIPGDAGASLLIRKISPNPPFGSRMPQGGTPLADTTIQVIREWIDQGALNN